MPRQLFSEIVAFDTWHFYFRGNDLSILNFIRGSIMLQKWIIFSKMFRFQLKIFASDVFRLSQKATENVCSGPAVIAGRS